MHIHALLGDCRLCAAKFGCAERHLWRFRNFASTLDPCVSTRASQDSGWQPQFVGPCSTTTSCFTRVLGPCGTGTWCFTRLPGPCGTETLCFTQVLGPCGTGTLCFTTVLRPQALRPLRHLKHPRRRRMIYIYIYIYLYTSVNPCISMHC